MKEKLNILFLAPRKIGGPHLSLKRLSNYLLKKNLIYGDFYSSINGFLIGIFSRKYDLIHTILPVPFNIWGTPILLNIRGNYKLERGLKNPLAFLYPISIFFSRQIVSPSNFLVKKLNLNNIKVIPNFVNEDLFNLKKEKRLNVKDEINLITLTKFHFKDKAYGILKLVKILNRINSKKKINFSIIGGGIYLDEVKDLIMELDLNRNLNIIWLNFQKEPFNFLLKSDIFVYYSNLDNFPNAILEAMAVKLPVITNNIGAVEEFIIDGESGFISKNDEDYKLKLEKLIVDKNLRVNMTVLSLKFITKSFLINFISSEFLKVYEKIYKK